MTDKMTALREAIEDICREWGISEHYSRDGIHGWRCEYEDRYGPCGDFQEFIDDLMLAIEGPVKPAPHEHVYVWSSDGSLDGRPWTGTPCLGCGHPYDPEPDRCTACGHPPHHDLCTWDVIYEEDDIPPYHLSCACDGTSGPRVLADPEDDR